MDLDLHHPLPPWPHHFVLGHQWEGGGQRAVVGPSGEQELAITFRN